MPRHGAVYAFCTDIIIGVCGIDSLAYIASKQPASCLISSAVV